MKGLVFSGRAALFAFILFCSFTAFAGDLNKVAKNESRIELSDGAHALAYYGAKEAIPILRKSLSREHDIYYQKRIIGKYDTKKFKFTPVMKIKGVTICG